MIVPCGRSAAATTTGGRENSTEPIAEQTMGTAAHLGDARGRRPVRGHHRAWAERQQLIERARTTTATPTGLAALEACLRSLTDGQAPVPVTIGPVGPALARQYIGGITGASPGQVRHGQPRDAVSSGRPARALPDGDSGDRTDRRKAVANRA